MSTPFSLCLQWQLSNLCAKHTNSTLPLSVNFRSEFSVQTAPCPCQSISGLSSVSKLHLAPVSHSQVCAKVSKLHLALSSEFYAKCHNCILLLSTHLSSGRSVLVNSFQSVPSPNYIWHLLTVFPSVMPRIRAAPCFCAQFPVLLTCHNHTPHLLTHSSSVYHVTSTPHTC